MASENLIDDIIERLKRQRVNGGSQKAAAAYVHEVAMLLDKIRGWLADVRKEGLIDFQDETHHLNVGSAGLTCPGLTIVSDKHEIQVIPAGNRVPGAAGRVDLVSTRKRKTQSLILSESGEWCVVEPIVTRSENYRESVIPLDEQRFLKIFRDLI